MKTLMVAILTIVLGVAYLHTDLSPWRIVDKGALDSLNQQVADLTQQLAAAQVHTAQVAHTGSWMWDPSYRTALEKTTIMGVPQAATPR